jgi:hypothetical protein
MTKNCMCFFIVLLLISASSIEARAGLTISDRRYWPNEARGAPSQMIETYSPSYAYPGAMAGFAAEPRIAPRGQARRSR